MVACDGKGICDGNTALVGTGIGVAEINNRAVPDQGVAAVVEFNTMPAGLLNQTILDGQGITLQSIDAGTAGFSDNGILQDQGRIGIAFYAFTGNPGD